MVSNKVLSAQDLSFSYEIAHPLFSHLTMTFETSKSYAIIGPSGCGKTTLLKILAGQIPCQTGSVLYQGEPLALHQQIFSWIYSEPFLIDDLNLKDNIFLDWPYRQERENNLAHYWKIFGLPARLSDFPKSLSSGEKQRVSAIRALMMERPFIMADEPTAHLDTERAHELVALLMQQIYSQERSLICVTHDTSLLKYFDVVYNLRMNESYDEKNS